MTLPRQKLRELVFEILFSEMFSSLEEEELLPFIMKEHLVSKKNVKEALVVKDSIAQKISEIDSLLKTVSQEYEYERIPMVEKTILRMQAFDILFNQEMPAKVAIAEGIRLTKKFSTEQSASFVNALLDAVYKEQSPA